MDWYNFHLKITGGAKQNADFTLHGIVGAQHLNGLTVQTIKVAQVT